VERVLGNAGVDKGSQAVGAAAELVVLLRGLDDSCEIDPREAFQLLGLLCYAVKLAQYFLQELLPLLLAELWFRRSIARTPKQPLALRVLVFLVILAFLMVRLDAYGQWLQLLFACRGSVAELLREVGNEVVHLLQLHVGQLVDECALVIGGPGVVIFVVLEQLLELVVVDVFIFPWRIHAFAQSRTELHGLAKVLNCKKL
jgi:hypothetical protein